MSLVIDIASLDDQSRSEIKKRCIIKPAKTRYNDDPDPAICFAVCGPTAYVPLGVWRYFFDTFPQRTYPKTNITTDKLLYDIDTDPKGYRDQKTVFAQAIKRLKEDHTVFIAASCGYGKTTIGLKLCVELKLKFAVLCHIDKVKEQWIDEFKENSTARVQWVKKKLDPSMDGYVIGVQKAATLPREALKDIGVLIFDEAHIAIVTAFTKSLLRFQPRYVIGLSATPKRSDGLHKLLYMYFGPKKGFIVRQEVKDFTVVKVETPYKPEIRYTMVRGVSTLDWIHVINTIAYNGYRQRDAVNLVLAHPEQRIMILSARKEECKAVHQMLIDEDQSSLLLIGNTKKRPEGYRVLVAGTKKAGVGFDDPTLTMMILMADCKNVEQFEGRIRTSNNIIYDFVDDFRPFENHWKLRSAWYEKRGATIEVRPRDDSCIGEERGLSKQRFLAPNTD